MRKIQTRSANAAFPDHRIETDNTDEIKRDGITFCRYLILALLVFLSARASSKINGDHFNAGMQDTSAIQLQLKKLRPDLHYPHTVERFYRQTGNQLAWIFPDTVKTHGWETMLMLDCVHQFGLNHDDYHPEKLLYPELHRLINNYNEVSIENKALFDVLLTDAVITFMNHLHYGKFNPSYPATRIDDQNFVGFRADTSLINAFKNKDFMTSVLSVQPQSKAYTLLQSHLRLITGQYVGDCYEVPEGEVKKIALNMERLRWIDMNEKNYIQINIPSYTLTLREPDTTYQFGVIVGDPAHPTPVLQSAISKFTTVPGWRIPRNVLLKERSVEPVNGNAYPENNAASSVSDYKKSMIVFGFSNTSGVYLRDAVDKALFKKDKRVHHQSAILVERSEKLAELLLANDGSEAKADGLLAAVQHRRARRFNLKKDMPVKITYLTCEIVNNMLVVYDDLYHRDKELEHKLYPENGQLSPVN